MLRSGALLIDKPRGLTSFAVIARLRGALARARGVKVRDLPKLGHAGTLDPFATGLLVVCVGEATKLLPHLLDSRKTYWARARFGATTASGDDAEPVTRTTAARPRNLEDLRVAARGFVGEYRQTPPMHSAIKQDGKRLYELAREGIEVERAPKLKRIHALEILAYDGEHAEFRVTCSAGTYVRTLAQDLAQRLGSLAYLTELRREASGSLALARAATLARAEEAVGADGGRSLGEAWIPLARLAAQILPAAEISSELAQALRQGRQDALEAALARAALPAAGDQAALALIQKGGELVATVAQGKLLRVFAAEA